MSYEELISNPFLDMETSCREGGCRDKYRVSGRTLRTLSFVNSGEGASDEIRF